MTSSTPSLKRQAFLGTLWTLFSFGFASCLRLVSNVVLFNLLGPSLLGLMNLVNTVMTGLHMFSDVGIGPNIIQSKRGDDPAYLNTAWTLQILRGGLIFLVCCLISLPAARFYHRGEMLWLMPVIGLESLFLGFQATSMFTLSRALNVRQIELYGLAEGVLMTGVMLGWAKLAPSVWAIVGGMVAVSLFRLVWTHRWVPGIRHRWQIEPQAVKDLLGMGKWFFFSTAVTFLGVNADRLLLGKLVPLDLLGIYAIAIGFSELPKLVVGAISAKVLLPTMSRLSDLPRSEFRQLLLKYRRLVLLCAVVLLALFVCFGDWLILALYSWKPEYQSAVQKAAWMLPILAAGIWPNLLHESIRQSLVAIGQPKYEAIGQLLKCLLVCFGVPFSFSYMQQHSTLPAILGPVLIVTLNDIPLFAAVMVGLQRQGLSSLRQDVLTTSLFVAVCGLLIALRWTVFHTISIQTLLIQ